MNAIRRRWAERPRLSPRVGVVLVGLWLGMSGNLALWRALSALPEMTGGRGAGLVATLAMLSAMASVVLLVPLAWTRTAAPALALAALGTAARTVLQLAPDGLAQADRLQALLAAAIVAGPPLVLLAACRLASPGRWWRQALRNLGLAAAAIAGAGAIWMLSFADLALTLHHHATLLPLLHPLGWLPEGSVRATTDGLFNAPLHGRMTG